MSPFQMQNYLQIFVIPYLQFNWVDLIIIVVFFFYALEGFAVGFVIASVDLLSFILSFALGLRLYSVLGNLLIGYFNMPHGFANAIGFFIVAILGEILFSFVLRTILRRMMTHMPVQKLSDPNTGYAYVQTANKVFGFLPGIASGMILLSFLLTMIVALPFSPFLKQSVSNSRLGSGLVANALGFEKDLNTVFGGAVNDTLNFLTVKPESNETVDLHFKTTDVTVDAASEQKMLTLLNNERAKKELPPLEMEGSLRSLARSYSRDMFARGYFSHYTPEGTSPFDRMSNAGISYTSAGENLALAPDVDLAMQGLMKSPGHRANILSPNYAKVGIGVMDGGIYGKMFTQEFSN
ncbi:MAG: CvpA family protein [Candidatus Levybacteria bacterium]|nr:CvpA family protein [Candidatus Levybacteria bacterium]